MSNDPALRAIFIMVFVCVVAGSSLLFVVAYVALRWLRWWRENRALAEAEAERAALAEIIAEQERADAQAQRILALVDTQPQMPALPALPALIPASSLDASDKTPAQATNNTYCLACWLEWIGQPEHEYFTPDGAEGFCGHHAHLTLAKAMNKQQQQQETGDKYL